VHGDDADVGHFAYPCERSQAIRRVPSSHSSTSALLFNPLMYWVSVPWTFGHDPPVVLCNPQHFEGHARRFFHVPNM
jgi:hypothetical protein